MQYSSRPPFNDDPRPWRCDDLRGIHYEGPGCSACVHAPRPEFDRPQNNPTNPILVAFRDYVAWRWVYLPEVTTYAEDVESFDGLRPDSFVGVTPAQIDHARRVLTRLANFTNDKEN